MRTTIALVGQIGSGKGEVSEQLKRKGYGYFTYRDKLIEELHARNLPLQREFFQETAYSLRHEYGKDMQARYLTSVIESYRQQGKAEKAVIDSLRHPADIQFLKEWFNTKIIGITAPFDVRFQRVLDRNRASDPKTKEGFILIDQWDVGNGMEYTDNMRECLALAHHTIDNSGTKKELEEQIEHALYTLGIEGIMRNKERYY